MSEYKLERISPSESGISPKALLKVYRDLNEIGNISSCMIVHHGKVVSEGWWKPFTAEKKHMLFSLSKSFTSIASAFADYEGLLDRSRPVLDYFPEYREAIPDIEENVAGITTRHLLSMTTGHEPNADLIFGYDDCVGAFFSSHTGHERGVGFSYNTGATYMVSAVVRRVTGMDIADYLRPRLFDPLGITDFTWEKSADGTSLGGYGLSLKLEDLARFGVFLLQRGMWNGKQLIPAEYIDEATCKHINNWGGSRYQKLDEFADDEEEPDDVKANDWLRGYGQQFWRCVPDGVYRGDGAFGQVCIVMPKYDVVVVSNAGGCDAQAQAYCFWRNITDEAFAPENISAADEEELDGFISSLSRELPGRSSDGIALLEKYGGCTYQLPKNIYGIEKFSLDFSDDGVDIKVRMNGASHSDYLRAGIGEWIEGKISYIDSDSDGDMNNGLSAVTSTATYNAIRSNLALAASAEADGLLRVRVLAVNTPFRVDFALRFEGGRVNIHIDGMSAPVLDIMGVIRVK